MTLLSFPLSVTLVPGEHEVPDGIELLGQVATRIARLEARLEQAVGEKEKLAALVAEQDRKLSELAVAVADLTRTKDQAREAVDGVLKLIATLESRLAVQRGG